MLGRGKLYVGEKTSLEKWRSKMGISSEEELLQYLNIFCPVGIERWGVNNNANQGPNLWK
jgi:hypothetical protein